jgi:hypothetical protein
MRTFSKFLLLVIACFGASSCMMSNQIRTIQIEILRPGIFNIPQDLSVAIIKRDLFKSDTCKFNYSNGILKVKESLQGFDSVYNSSDHIEEVIYEMKKDTSIKYANLSETCVHALSDYFKEIGYFHQVLEPNDSIDQLISIPGKIETSEELFERTKTDLCIFLDYLQLKTIYNKNQYIPFQAKAKLLWTVALKSDSLAYTYTQEDTLFYDHMQLAPYQGNKDKILSNLVNNSSIYLGNSFGSKMIPSWIEAGRMFYKSQNPEMLKAEKFAINQDWIKAAEIWNKLTKNKNKKIAAKACFNMALACEMEGKPDLSIAWLVQSYSCLKKNNEDHKYNCQHYVNVLALRKLEIERLEEQVSVQELSNKTEN